MSRDEDQGVRGAVNGSETVPSSYGDSSDIEDISEEIRKKPKKKNEEQDSSVKQFRKKKKGGWIKWVVIIAVIAAIIAFVVHKTIQTKNKVMEALNSNTSSTAEVKRMDISKAISTTGTIQSKDVRTLTSRLAGVKIDKVNYKVGDMVNEGAIVVAFSVDDINKKIGQLEEDITEAKQAKALDAGDRNNTYVNSYDLQTYSVANAYEKLQRADVDLQKAKDELQRVCDQRAEFKALHEEAKENIEKVEKEYKDKQLEYNATDPTDTQKLAELQVDIDNLYAKITTYRTAMGDNYDTKITGFEDQEKVKFDLRDTAQRNYDTAWVEFNKAGYDASFGNAKTDYTNSKGNLTANDNVKNLERQKEQNEDSLADYIVTAPITGLVTSVNAEEGNGYQATSGALMTIQAVDILEVSTQVDEYDINSVQIGQHVAIMTDATGEDELEGRVTFIAPVATAVQGNNTTSNTFEVKIDIVKKDERLKLGMSAKLNILVDTHDNVLAVPYDAIEEKDGQTYVYVIDRNAAEKKPSDSGTTNILGIEVFTQDGKQKNTTSEPSKPVSGEKGKPADAREIPVQIGLESDYYTEIISPQISEGMTVVVNSTAGDVKNDLDILMGM